MSEGLTDAHEGNADGQLADIEAGREQVELELWHTAQQKPHDTSRPLSSPDNDDDLTCCSPHSLDSPENIQVSGRPALLHRCARASSIHPGNQKGLHMEPRFLQKIPSPSSARSRRTTTGCSHCCALSPASSS
ncbi:hypothetical protein HPB50_001913 [Hyalomma asiaticum]|uniref:Uncharacterized protein n=1 Tax=Hyalomma asiaticum TaxID=266040 RepID=A0ACB7TCR0_HYAAI|nr:hypothetical protein HPB50_001913 [Hyalomma asiaticum]